jgi:hypothetical protein
MTKSEILNLKKRNLSARAPFLFKFKVPSYKFKGMSKFQVQTMRKILLAFGFWICFELWILNFKLFGPIIAPVLFSVISFFRWI